ncbi:uncharacterized protein LOC109199921 isoform X1 [Oreochromis niloticus]|uniref:Uncharacterized LOC109199921 n=1 Tax=Oreochromis niloticus TaxID=8128 RepID=A0A669C444_ORENI|nr:uncharacterized protein LOC109199921 isoform X1 [Oreochromis niloticus]
MAAYVMPHRLKHTLPIVSDVPPAKREKSEDSPAGVSQIVSAHKDERFPLKKLAGATLRKAGLEDTVYKDNFLVVNGWGKFYLAKAVTMKVIGVVEDISCPCEQLLLMTCEDQQVYVYDEEELHLVALSIKQLLHEGMEYPASTTYYRGEAFKDMSNENRADTSMSDFGKRLDEEYKKLVAERKSSILENLKHSRKQIIQCC